MFAKLGEPDTKVRLMRWVYTVFGPCALALGLWMAIAPASFWGLIKVNDTDPVVQTIYGAALCGMGVICLLGVRQPLRYAAILLLMMVYKTIMFIALVPRLALMDDAPIAGWVIAAIWLCIAIVSALVYPWGRQRELLEARQGHEEA